MYTAGSSSQLIKEGAGKLTGIVIPVHSNGVINVNNSISTNYGEATKATNKLTITGGGGKITAGVHARTVLTSTGVNPAATHTLTIGDQVYTFVSALTDIQYEVLIGATAQDTILNIMAAINGTLRGEGGYDDGTPPSFYVFATNPTATTLDLIAIKTGTEYKSIETSTTSARLSFEDTTIGGGAGASITGVAGETLYIHGKTYTVVQDLTEVLGGYSVENEVLFGTTDETCLENIKKAVNIETGSGEKYSKATEKNIKCEATEVKPTSISLRAIEAGTAGNDYKLETDMVHGTLDGATFTGGAEEGVSIFMDYTLTTDQREITIPASIDFTNGLYIDVTGGTVNYTVFYE